MRSPGRLALLLAVSAVAAALGGAMIASAATLSVKPSHLGLFILTVEAPTPTPTPGGEGCSLGFWKQHQHFALWPPGYSSEDEFEGRFGRDVPDNPTLIEALNLEGGDLNALMRQAVAALLNAASDDVDYPYTSSQVISMFQTAYDEGEADPTKNLFEAANDGDCPLPPPEAGTSIEAEKSAVGFHEGDEDEAEDKSIDEGDDGKEVGEGHNGDEVEGIVGVRGEICVTNTGDETTQALKIVDQVQYKVNGPFQDLDGATLTIIPENQLQPGETACYPYEIVFEPPSQAKGFTNTAKITITNYAGHLGEEYGPEAKDSFELANGDDDLEDHSVIIHGELAPEPGIPPESSATQSSTPSETPAPDETEDASPTPTEETPTEEPTEQASPTAVEETPTPIPTE